MKQSDKLFHAYLWTCFKYVCLLKCLSDTKWFCFEIFRLIFAWKRKFICNSQFEYFKQYKNVYWNMCHILMHVSYFIALLNPWNYAKIKLSPLYLLFCSLKLLIWNPHTLYFYYTIVHKNCVHQLRCFYRSECYCFWIVHACQLHVILLYKLGYKT